MPMPAHLPQVTEINSFLRPTKEFVISWFSSSRVKTLKVVAFLQSAASKQLVAHCGRTIADIFSRVKVELLSLLRGGMC